VKSTSSQQLKKRDRSTLRIGYGNNHFSQKSSPTLPIKKQEHYLNHKITRKLPPSLNFSDVISLEGYNEPSGSLSPLHLPIAGGRKRDQQKTAKEQILIA
jgi:hypothetical protein